MQDGGNKVEEKLSGGVVGLILDGRGRPLMTVPDDKSERIEQMLGWLENLKVYNMDELRALGKARSVRRSPWRHAYTPGLKVSPKIKTHQKTDFTP